MVVTDAALATQVGRDVLARGGNAVDAAVATAFALAVVYPTAGNIGGGGFMVARVGGTAHALDFRETAPAAATADMYRGQPEAAQEGPRSVGVPGAVAGLHAAFERLGSKTLSWASLLAPAIALAADGFVADEDFEGMITEETERLGKSPGARALFLPGGKPVARGTRWKNPDLARTLKRIAESGPAGFYAGETAQLVAAEMKSTGGLVTAADLAAYRAKWREPLPFTYRGHTVLTMPPPSSGGVALAMMGHILEGWDVGKTAWRGTEHLHLEVEAMRRAFAARNARLGDPDFVQNPVAELTSDAWAKAQRATIAKDRATPSADVVAATAPPEGMHTTHFSIIDAAGNAVAITTTVNWWFGSGIVVRGAGFVLNNEMDDFAAIPGTANGFGLVQSTPNAVAPGKRMLSSMTPTIVLGKDGQVELVAGAAGGPTIITAVFGVLSSMVDFDKDVATAIGAPRIHMQHQPDVVLVEAGGLAAATRAGLERMGYTLKDTDRIADAVAIGHDARGWLGAAEPRRKGGLALGVP
jgi:gamma-glutamyltranspeptidase / glutathione hydrolase